MHGNAKGAHGCGGQPAGGPCKARCSSSCAYSHTVVLYSRSMKIVSPGTHSPITDRPIVCPRAPGSKSRHTSGAYIGRRGMKSAAQDTTQLFAESSTARFGTKAT